jgi:putative intracellular protease/amidase
MLIYTIPYLAPSQACINPGLPLTRIRTSLSKEAKAKEKKEENGNNNASATTTITADDAASTAAVVVPGLTAPKKACERSHEPC